MGCRFTGLLLLGLMQQVTILNLQQNVVCRLIKRYLLLLFSEFSALFQFTQDAYYYCIILNGGFRKYLIQEYVELVVVMTGIFYVYSCNYTVVTRVGGPYHDFYFYYVSYVCCDIFFSAKCGLHRLTFSRINIFVFCSVISVECGLP